MCAPSARGCLWCRRRDGNVGAAPFFCLHAFRCRRHQKADAKGACKDDTQIRKDFSFYIFLFFCHFQSDREKRERGNDQQRIVFSDALLQGAIARFFSGMLLGVLPWPRAHSAPSLFFLRKGGHLDNSANGEVARSLPKVKKRSFNGVPTLRLHVFLVPRLFATHKETLVFHIK